MPLSDTIDSFETPDRERFSLVGDGHDFYFALNGAELMSTQRTVSEVALAEIGCRGLEGVRRPRVLIGGLGLGFTLRAALELLPPDAELVVAELFPQVVEWNLTHLRALYGPDLEDPRLRIVVGDVWDQARKGSWNSILLDADNGPEAFSLLRNGRLYGNIGLERFGSALLAQGTLTVWSADPVPGFLKRLTAAGFEASREIVRDERDRGQPYTIFVGRKLA
jgi:spermidine synthase